MKSRIFACILWSAFALVFVQSGIAEEGMWLPNDLPTAVVQKMQELGCELTPEQIYNEQGTGVANAVVQLGGGTGSFVSPNGLIITNHHVAYRSVQRISTADNNFIETGFLAKTRTEEQPAVGYNAFVLLSVENVTGRIQAALFQGMNPLERFDAIENISKAIVQEAEAGRDVYCYVRSIFEGQKYFLFTFKKIEDIRIVYVPPRSIGEFGGDIDNWMWPRHTGDFSFLRAYIGPDGQTAEYSEKNVPYQPKSFLKIAKEGLKDGEFALIAGYPGRTSRFMTSFGISNQQNYSLPQRIELYQRWIDILESFSEKDAEAAVKVIGTIKGLNNGLKYRQGVMDGFRKFNLLEKKQESEAEFTEFISNDPVLLQKYGGILPKIESIYENYKTVRQKTDLLGLMERTQYFGFASTIYQWSLEKEKPDLERDPGFMERRVPSLKRRLKEAQTTLHPDSDREVLRMFLQMAAELPESQRIQGLEKWLKGKSGEELESSIDELLVDLYDNTVIGTAEKRLQLFNMDNRILMKQNDPFITLYSEIYPEIMELEKKQKAFRGALSEIDPLWIEGIQIWKGDLYADANGTMRINYGVVRGYSPEDAVWYEPFTTLSGIVDKNTGEKPFDVPEKLRDLHQSRTYAAYADATLQDIPVDFLTTNDSTGGNSGSPVLNGKGELAGVLFDGNYEAMSADYDFNEELTRSIHVDIRYVLFVTDLIGDAQNVLVELGVK